MWIKKNKIIHIKQKVRKVKKITTMLLKEEQLSST